jgi:hypothetical protein
MELWTDNRVSVAKRRGEVVTRIERLLLIRSLVGNWTPERQAEYAALRDEERALLERMGELMEVRV